MLVTGVLILVSCTGACDSVQPNGFAWQISQSKPQPPHWRLFAATHPKLSRGRLTLPPHAAFVSHYHPRAVAVSHYFTCGVTLSPVLSHSTTSRVIPQHYSHALRQALLPVSRLSGGLAAITNTTTSQSLEQLNQEGALPTRSGYNSSLPTREYENMRI